MYIIGDIGNTEIKIYLANNNYIKIKKILLKTSLVSNTYINKKLKFLKNKKIKFALFSSVVPYVYKKLQIFGF